MTKRAIPLLCTALVAASLALVSAPITAEAAPVDNRPRTIVTTDIENDDYNSLIRYLLYTNETNTEAFVYTSSKFHWAGDGQGTLRTNTETPSVGPTTQWRWTGTSHLQDMIGQYAKGYENLKTHDSRYPSPAELLSKVKVGNITFEGEMDSDTEGSDAIKQVLLDDKPGPVYLQVWGGSNTIARALKSIEDEYSASPAWSQIKAKVSKKAIMTMQGAQDTTYANYIKVNWPDLQTVLTGSGIWGFYGGSYRNGSCSTAGSDKAVDAGSMAYFQGPWLKANIKDAGSLGALYRLWGDRRTLWGDQLDVFGDLAGGTFSWLYPPHCDPNSAAVGRTAPPWDDLFEPARWDFFSEGDNPAFLYLWDTGLRSMEDWTWGGWAGRFRQSTTSPDYWVTNNTEENKLGANQNNYASGRWGAYMQLDFAARLQWLLKPADQSNDHPVLSVPTGLDVDAAPGETITLRGTATDPDAGDSVSTTWWEYKEAGTGAGAVTISDPTSLQTSVTIPDTAVPGDTYHVILEGTDTGTPALTKWQRVVITVTDTVAPTVSQASPAKISTKGGDTVTLTGSNLRVVTDVTFGGEAGTDLVVAEDGKSLTVDAPAHAAGSVAVQVVAPSGAVDAGTIAYAEPPAADKAVLQSVTNSVAAMNKSTYTADSWARLAAAVTTAKAVLANADATQPQVDEALSAVVDGLAGLKVAVQAPAPDKAVLQAVVNSAGTLSNAGGKYTSASWTKLQREIADAKKVLASKSATQAQIDQATRELSSAMSDLAPIVVSKVKLSQSQLRLVKGKSFKLEDGVYFTNAPATYWGTTWKSSSSKVATVSSTGTIKAKKAGTVTITATSTKANASGKKVSASVQVTVVAKKQKAKVTSVTAGVPSSLKVGKTVYVTGTYASSKATGVKVTYKSLNPSKIEVDAAGRIIAKAKGIAKIQVKAAGKTKTYTVVVT